MSTKGVGRGPDLAGAGVREGFPDERVRAESWTRTGPRGCGVRETRTRVCLTPAGRQVRVPTQAWLHALKKKPSDVACQPTTQCSQLS